jgi:hypothetical protein
VAVLPATGHRRDSGDDLLRRSTPVIVGGDALEPQGCHATTWATHRGVLNYLVTAPPAMSTGVTPATVYCGDTRRPTVLASYGDPKNAIEGSQDVQAHCGADGADDSGDCRRRRAQFRRFRQTCGEKWRITDDWSYPSLIPSFLMK